MLSYIAEMYTGIDLGDVPSLPSAPIRFAIDDLVLVQDQTVCAMRMLSASICFDDDSQRDGKTFAFAFSMC